MLPTLTKEQTRAAWEQPGLGDDVKDRLRGQLVMIPPVTPVLTLSEDNGFHRLSGDGSFYHWHYTDERKIDRRIEVKWGNAVFAPDISLDPSEFYGHGLQRIINGEPLMHLHAYIKTYSDVPGLNPWKFFVGGQESEAADTWYRSNTIDNTAQIRSLPQSNHRFATKNLPPGRVVDIHIRMVHVDDQEMMPANHGELPPCINARLICTDEVREPS